MKENIKNQAISYLMKNPVLHMGMIEPIRRNTADILYTENDGVLLKEQKSNAYMISVNSIKKGRELIDKISECDLIVSHQLNLVDYIMSRFELTEKLECVQAVYMRSNKLEIKEDLEIIPLQQNQLNIILEHYDTLSDNELKTLLNEGNIFGGYKNGTLIGFAGNHLEGSIGLLVIFPEYRRLGYGTALESFLVNQMLEKGQVPFVQIEVNNKNSIDLQNKLGFKISEDKVYWLF